MLEHMTIEFSSGIPVYKQIINRVRTEVAAGNMKEGDQLPTIRKLTDVLNVNPNTVAKAYRELELSGVISSRRGSGSFINKTTGDQTGMSEREKTTKLNELYERLKSEANGFGISEAEILDYIRTRSQK